MLGNLEQLSCGEFVSDIKGIVAQFEVIVPERAKDHLRHSGSVLVVLALAMVVPRHGYLP